MTINDMHYDFRKKLNKVTNNNLEEEITKLNKKEEKEKKKNEYEQLKEKQKRPPSDNSLGGFQLIEVTSKD